MPKTTKDGGVTIYFKDLDNPDLVTFISSPAFATYLLMRSRTTRTKDGLLVCSVPKEPLSQMLGGCSHRKLAYDIQLLKRLRLLRSLQTGYALGEWERRGRGRVDIYYLDRLLAGEFDKLPTQSGRPGFIYIIKVVDYYKIGKEARELTRVRDHQIASPFDIEVIVHQRVDDCDSTESQLHRMYASKCVRGEWFALTDEDIATIREYLDERQCA